MSEQQDAPRRLWADRPVLVKIIVAVVVMMAVTAVVTAVAVTSIRSLQADAAAMYRGNVTPLQQLTEIQRAYQGDRARVIQYGIADTETRATLVDELAERHIDLDSQIEAYRANAVSQADVDTMVAALDAYYTAAQGTLFPLADEGDAEGFATYFNETIRPLTTGVMDAMQVETASQGEAAAALAETTESHANTAVLTTLLVAVLGAIAAAGLAYLVARGIVGRIGAVSRSLTAAGDGDLTVSAGVTGRDELGQMGAALERTLVSLRGLIAGVVESSVSIASSAQSLAGVASSFSASSEETAAQSGVVAAAAE
ncbi:MCP four helix bundle domain-containing protein, partial [Oerskovia turbata]